MLRGARKRAYVQATSERQEPMDMDVFESPVKTLADGGIHCSWHCLCRRACVVIMVSAERIGEWSKRWSCAIEISTAAPATIIVSCYVAWTCSCGPAVEDVFRSVHTCRGCSGASRGVSRVWRM